MTNVELTCQDDTNDVVVRYEWFKDNGAAIPDAESKVYGIPGNTKSNSGSYQCKVHATNVPPKLSDAKTVTFLCKFVS